MWELGVLWRPGYLLPGLLNLGSYLPLFLCPLLACGDGPLGAQWLLWRGLEVLGRVLLGCPHLHFSSVQLCGCAFKHFTGRTGKGATVRFLSYCLSFLWIQENLATEAVYTNKQTLFYPFSFWNYYFRNEDGAVLSLTIETIQGLCLVREFLYSVLV